MGVSKSLPKRRAGPRMGAWGVKVKRMEYCEWRWVGWVNVGWVGGEWGGRPVGGVSGGLREGRGLGREGNGGVLPR